MSDRSVQFGPWAVVTGASAGIGRALAVEAASRGYNVVLVARRETVLADVALQLTRDHQVQTRVIVLDFTDPEAPQLLLDATENLDVGLLIANAGRGQTGSFLGKPLTEHEELVRINLAAPMALTHGYGRRFIQRSHGAILLVSSPSAYHGTPFITNYGATKAYLHGLAEGLGEELRDRGVWVSVLTPGLTRTATVVGDAMDYDRMGAHWMEPERVAREAFASLGRVRDIIPGRRNRLLFRTMQFLPRVWAARMMGLAVRRGLSPELLEPMPEGLR